MNTKALPDPIEVETLVRTTAFQLLITRGEPVAPEQLAEASGIRAEQLADVLHGLNQAGRIRSDRADRVIGSAGLSVVPDRHQIEVEGRKFWTWCAYDIFGIFGALSASGLALSPSPPDRKPIEVHFVRGRPHPSDAVLFRFDAELMDCCDNVYEQWCPNSNLFASRELAEGWAGAHELSGRVLSLEEAADLATDEWQATAAGVIITSPPSSS